MLKTFVLLNSWNTIMSSKTVMGQIGNNLRMWACSNETESKSLYGERFRNYKFLKKLNNELFLSIHFHLKTFSSPLSLHMAHFRKACLGKPVDLFFHLLTYSFIRSLRLRRRGPMLIFLWFISVKACQRL